MGSTHGVNTSNKPKPKNTTTAQPTLADASCVARRWSSPCSLACSGALGAALLALLLGALVPNTPSNAPGLLPGAGIFTVARSEEHTSELQSRFELVCRLLLE